MSLRSILVSLLSLGFVIIAATVVELNQYFLSVLGSILPETVHIFIGPLPPEILSWILLGISVSVIFIAFIVFYFVIDRFFVHPILMVSRTLTGFVEQSNSAEIPTFSLATKEMRSLTDAFSEFAKRANSVHSRDMEISRVKSDFITTAAHQIRTPLTGIRWALEALAKEPLTDMQKQLVQSAADKSHDLVAIIGTLLDISSIESGKFKYKFEIASASSIVESIATDFAQLAKDSNIALRYEKSADVLPPVRVDTERIKWVLNNLVENAIRYTPAGGSVTIGTSTISGRVLVQVKDTGIGIPEGDRNNIFERFYRAGNAIEKQNQGNGLGLYIARTIANDHGGDLNFETTPAGVGTTFTLSLPIAQAVAG